MGQNGPKLFFHEFWGQTISNEGSHAYVWTKLENMGFSVPFGPFRPIFWSKCVEMARNYFFLNSAAKWFPMRGHMPMFEENFKKWYFRSLFDLFWPIFWSKWVKMTQNYFFLNSEAKRFPTRGHMPMFVQNLKKWYFRSLFDPFWPIFWSKWV